MLNDMKPPCCCGRDPLFKTVEHYLFKYILLVEALILRDERLLKRRKVQVTVATRPELPSLRFYPCGGNEDGCCSFRSADLRALPDPIELLAFGSTPPNAP
jgi:hypothetical protein